MCGIIGYVGNRDVVPVIIGGLKKLEYRGYDSAGIAVVNGNGVEVVRAEVKLSNLEAKLPEHNLKGSFGMGHTRWATHGKPNENNAHPHRDCSKRDIRSRRRRTRKSSRTSSKTRSRAARSSSKRSNKR